MTTETAPSARVAIFKWLQRKYVQNQDARQKALGLVYMTAETHDLAEEIERQVAPLDAEIARLQAQVAELQALSVKNIMIAVVPGDGSGEEVYAQSVADVEALLFRFYERAEEADSLQAQVDALAGALDVAKRTMADYGQCDNDNWPCFQVVCAALATVGR